MAPPVWSVGQVLTASDVNTWFVPLAAYKTADETVTSSTTLQNDNDLLLATAANAFYTFHCTLFYKGAANNTSDLKWTWTAPASAVLRYDADYNQVSLTGTLGNQHVTADVLSAGTNTTANVLAVRMTGHYTTAGTSGNLTLQWAQNTSNATATTMGTGSHLTMFRTG